MLSTDNFTQRAKGLLLFFFQTNEALIAPLLRSADHKVHVKEAEKVLLKKQKFSELIILYQQHKMHIEGEY